MSENYPIIEWQENVLSDYLKKVRKRHDLFFYIMPIVIAITVLVFFEIFSDKPIGNAIIGLLIIVGILEIGFFIQRFDVMHFRSIGYTETGIYMKRRSGKTYFLAWKDIRKVEAIKKWWKVSIPDYIMLFHRPHPGWAHLNEDVAKKIEEYQNKYAPFTNIF